MPIYMKIEGIPMTGTGKGTHEKWIELLSCQLGTHRNIKDPTGSSVNREASVPSVSQVDVTEAEDDMSSALFSLALNGSGKKVIIDFTNREGDFTYLTIELENVLISSFNVSGHGGTVHDRAMESLSLNFTKI